MAYALQHDTRLLKREQGLSVKNDNGKNKGTCGSGGYYHRWVDVAAERTAANVRAQQAPDAAAEQTAADVAEAQLSRLQEAAEAEEAQQTFLIQQSVPSNPIIIKPTQSPLPPSSSYGPIPSHKRSRSRWTRGIVELTD